jgi:nucleoside-diphosphate-sugar epimerase
MKLLRVLVVGATGFVGRAVVLELASSGVPHIRATSRRITKDEFSDHESVESVPCDIMDKESVLSVMHGVDAVIDCYRDETNERASFLGICNVLDACLAHKVSKLVYLSSTAVYGEALGVVNEDTIPVEPISWYGKAKLVAEAECKSRASEKLKIAIVRPPLVYGPRGEEWSLRFITSISRGRLIRLGANGDGIANLVYISDLAEFCVHLTKMDLPRLSTYNVNAPNAKTFNEYIHCLTSSLRIDTSFRGRRPERFYLVRVRRFARGAVKVLQRLLRPVLSRLGGLDSVFARLQVALKAGPEDIALRGGFSKDVFYTSARAQAVNFEPKVSLCEGVRASVEYAKGQGIV